MQHACTAPARGVSFRRCPARRLKQVAAGLLAAAACVASPLLSAQPRQPPPQALAVQVIERGLPEYSYGSLERGPRGRAWITTPGAPEPALLLHEFGEADVRRVQRIPLTGVPLGVTASVRLDDHGHAVGVFGADGGVRLVVLRSSDVPAIELPLPKIQLVSSLAWVGRQIVAGGQTVDGKPWVAQFTPDARLLRERVLPAEGQAQVSDVGQLGAGLVAVINPTAKAGNGQLTVLSDELAPVRSVRAAGAAVSAAFSAQGLLVSYSQRQERFLERLDPGLKRVWQLPLPRRTGESLARAVLVATPAYVAAVSGNDGRLAVTMAAPDGTGAATWADDRGDLLLPVAGYAVDAQPGELTVMGLARTRQGTVSDRLDLFKAVVTR